MTEISVGFTIVIPGSLDPDMHFGLEVKWLIDFEACQSQKAHLHPLRNVCMQYEMNQCMGFQDMLRKRNVARNQAY